MTVPNYRRTRLACFSAYLSMSSVFVLPPMLFTTFRAMYGISFTLLGTLVAAFKLFGFMVFLVMLIAVVAAFFGMFAFAKKSGLYNKVVLKDRLEENPFRFLWSF